MDKLLQEMKDDIYRVINDRAGLTWTNEMNRSKAIKNLCIAYNMLKSSEDK